MIWNALLFIQMKREVGQEPQAPDSTILQKNRNKRNGFVYNPNFEGINELITFVSKLGDIGLRGRFRHYN